MISTSVRGGALKHVIGATLLALATAGTAQAAIITFDGNSGSALNGDTVQEAGYAINFTTVDATPPGTVQIGRFINGADPASCGATNICPGNNATRYFDLFGTGYVDIVPSSGTGTFSFRGLDASFIGTSGTGYPPIPGGIQVVGFVDGVEGGRVQFNLEGPADGTASFARFKASSDFAQMQFNEIAIVGFVCDAEGQCAGLNNNAGQFALDNIVLSDVPEPGTAALLALGLLGLGSFARRRA